MNSCWEGSHCSSSHVSLCIMEEVTMCRRNSSIEAVHSQHTVETSINSMWEECTSKLFQICSYSLAGSHLYLHWAFSGTRSAQLSPGLLYQIFNRKRTVFTARWDQTHLHCVWQLESHFLPFSSLTLALGTVTLRDTEFSAKNLHWSKMMTSRWTADTLFLYSFLYIASSTHMVMQVFVPNKY